MAGFLVGSLPDLTTLSERNDGVFPVTRVYSTIDGTTTIGAHGSREMPVWGKEFYQSSRDGSQGISTETIVRGQIMELLIYLRSIQQ